MFKSISNRFNVTLLEEEIARLWKTYRVSEKLRSPRPDEQAFTLYECPPQVAGKPNLQIAFARIHQDMWLRYKTMQRLNIIRHTAWNTHGLPIELLAEKRLGLSNFLQVEQHGLARFNDFCNNLSAEFVNAWEALDERLNGWDALETAPVAHHKRSIEVVWDVFKRAWDAGLVHQDEGVLPYCPRCGTVLADYEVELGMKQQDILTAYVRLPLVEDPNTALLIWTDRPWSLLGSVAVAVNPEAEYVIVEHDLPDGEAGEKSQPEKLILAKSAFEHVFGDEPVRVYETFLGLKLKDLRYRPLFQFLLADRPLHRVVMEDFYVPDTGSGLLPVSPAFDAHDLLLAQQNDLPMLTPIAPDGKFVVEIRPWRGMDYRDAENYILQDLHDRGLLYRTETRFQATSFCWNCGTSLLPYMRKAWFLRTRISDKDWAISRDRFWGTPLPLWQCIQCGHQHVVSTLDELTHLVGHSLADLDLHRPWIDEIAFACPRCEGLMRRLPQVLDSQMDAAVLSLFQMPRQEGKNDLADLLCEVPSQAEGWLFALNNLNSLFLDAQAFKYMIKLPWLVENTGKTPGHDRYASTDPWDVIHDHGADALHWAILSTQPSAGQLDFSNELLGNARNQLIYPLWNALALLVNSAVQAGWSPNVSPMPSQGSLSTLDRWILSRLHLLIQEMTSALEVYDSLNATLLLQMFIHELAGWYIPRSQPRYGEDASDQNRQAAFSVLYQVLVVLSHLLSIFTPFLSEEIYQKLVRTLDLSAPVSVHLTTWPTPDQTFIDLELDRQMTLVQRIASMGHQARKDAGIALQQPLSEALITLGSQDEATILNSFTGLLADALHVRTVRYAIDESLAGPDELQITLDSHLTLELIREGLADEFIRQVQDFRQKAGFDSDASVQLFINATPRLADAINALQSRIMKGTRCLDLKLVAHQPGAGPLAEQGRSSRRLYTMIEFDGERATFGIEKVSSA